jgi:flagellar M-ring protein FliF
MNMTSFMQRIQHLRALEGELARTIVTLDGVRSARVHIVLPERETFARDTPKATASVAVTMAGPARLTTQQAAAIRLLVSGAVPGLSGDSVSVLDPNGVVMAADDGEGAASGRLSELKAAREQELKHAVTDLLEPLVGHDKLRVEASVELDDSREVSHEEKFDPLSQIERSKQIESDQDATNETKSSEPVSVAQNMPNQGSGQSGEPGKASTNNSRNGQTINYEINSVRSDRVREAGELKRMTIAVVVDGITDDKGHYQERAQDELTRLSELIQSAVGFDANRGDRVTVETMRFMPETPIGTAADADPRQFGQTPVTWIAIGGTVALVLVGGMLMMRKRGKARSGEWDEDGAAPMPYLSSDSRLAAAMAGASQLAAGVDGQLRPALAAAGMAENPQQTLLTALFDTVDQRPDEAVAALRSWLSGTA